MPLNVFLFGWKVWSDHPPFYSLVEVSMCIDRHNFYIIDSSLDQRTLLVLSCMPLAKRTCLQLFNKSTYKGGGKENSALIQQQNSYLGLNAEKEGTAHQDGEGIELAGDRGFGGGEEDRD